MSLVGKWIDLIYRVATGGWRVKVIVAPIVGASYLAFIVVLVLLSLVVDRWLSFPRASVYPASLVIGSCLITFGLFLTVLSVVHFVRVRGTPVPFSPPPELVVTGPYRFSRNPMLTGIFIQLYGIAVVLGSLSLAILFIPVFMAMNVWELKKVEEPELARRLGQAYIDYKKRVPMFFPFRKPR